MKNVRVMLPDGIVVTYPSKLGILKLVATNVVFGKYKDNQGKEQRGWTAALSMMIGDDRETMKAFKVHAGKSVQFDKFAVNVLGIDRSRNGMIVLAEIAAEE